MNTLQIMGVLYVCASVVYIMCFVVCLVLWKGKELCAYDKVFSVKHMCSMGYVWCVSDYRNLWRVILSLVCRKKTKTKQIHSIIYT